MNSFVLLSMLRLFSWWNLPLWKFDCLNWDKKKVFTFGNMRSYKKFNSIIRLAKFWRNIVFFSPFEIPSLAGNSKLRGSSLVAPRFFFAWVFIFLSMGFPIQEPVPCWWVSPIRKCHYSFIKELSLFRFFETTILGEHRWSLWATIL